MKRKLVRPKDKTFTDTSGDTVIFTTRNCQKGDTKKRIDVLDIAMKMAKKLLEHAKWMEKNR